MDTVRQRHEEAQVMVKSSLKGVGELGLLNGGPRLLLLCQGWGRILLMKDSSV